MTEDEDYRPTLGEMSHTNPYTDEVFGSTQTYSRGRTLAADGGKANAASRPSSGESDGSEPDASPEDAETDETIADVDHEPPRNAESANAAYQRGNEDDA